MTDTAYEWVDGGACVVCGKDFDETHLSSKQTCSNACRQKLHRYRERVETAFYRMWDDVSFYETAIDIPGLQNVSIEKLQSIQSRIERLLNRVQSEVETEDEYSLY